jgi:hypothetical protein
MDGSMDIPGPPGWRAEDLADARGDRGGAFDVVLLVGCVFATISTIAAAVLAARGLAAAAGIGGFLVIVFGARFAIGRHDRKTKQAERLAELRSWLAQLPFEVRGIAAWLGDARSPIDVVDDGAHELADIAPDEPEIVAYRIGEGRVRIELPRHEEAAATTPDDLRLLGRVLTGLARQGLDGIRLELGGPLRR